MIKKKKQNTSTFPIYQWGTNEYGFPTNNEHNWKSASSISKKASKNKPRKTVYKAISGNIYTTEKEAMNDNGRYLSDPSYRFSYKSTNFPHYDPLFIPFIENKRVTLSDAGLATGAIISTNLLDSIAKYAEQTGLPIKTALGLATKESTLGNPTDDSSVVKLIGKDKALMMQRGQTGQHLNTTGAAIDARELVNYYKDTWNPYEVALEIADEKSRKLVPAPDGNVYDNKGNIVGTRFYHDDPGYEEYKQEKELADNKRRQIFNDILLSGEKYADNLAEKYKDKIKGNILEAAFTDYKNNPHGYNPGQPNYSELVERRASEVWNSPEIQAWYNDYKNQKADGGSLNSKTWDNLSMAEKSEMMRVAIENGITTLPEIKEAYNQFAEGGDIPPITPFSQKEEVIITPDSEYNVYLNTLPDNQRFTPNDKYDSYLYWKLNGRPRNFEQAYSEGMFTYDNSDNAYHANSIAWGDDGIGYFMKPKTHDTVKYELDWFNKGLVTEEGGKQRPETAEERKNSDIFRHDYELIDDPNRPNFYRYQPVQHSYGGNLFSGEENHSSQMHQGYVYDVLPKMLKEAGLNVRVTSGYRRPGQAGKAGNRSWHTHHGAVDIVPQGKTTFEDIENALYNNPIISRYMIDNGFGLIDESGRTAESKATMKKTGATGAHFHIGKDSKAVSAYSNKMSSIWDNNMSQLETAINQPTLPVFMPSNPQAFFTPLESYQRPVVIEEPLVQAAMENPYSPEQLEREERAQGLRNLGLAMSIMRGGQEQSYSPLWSAVSMLSGNQMAKGGKIHIKPENRGKFTALKKRTGHSATWFKQHGTPAQKKMATFALNSKKWKHSLGGHLFGEDARLTFLDFI